MEDKMKIKEIKTELDVPSSYVCGARVILVLEDGSTDSITYSDIEKLLKSPYPENEWDDRGCIINSFQADPYPENEMIGEIYFTKQQYESVVGLFELLFNGYGTCNDCN